MIRRFLIVITITGLIFTGGTFFSFAEDLDHVEKLFDLRSAISDQGNVIPTIIKKTSGKDLRTLERVFELNTSTLTMMEAYFRILTITLASGSESNPEAIKILNEWLLFMQNQSNYDMDYLSSTIKETSNPEVLIQLEIAKKNILELNKMSKAGISETRRMQKEASE
ncbi:MAG: hypothetical protein ABH869_01325 [Candidatus Omnitrophota bacterium]